MLYTPTSNWFFCLHISFYRRSTEITDTSQHIWLLGGFQGSKLSLQACKASVWIHWAIFSELLLSIKYYLDTIQQKNKTEKGIFFHWNLYSENFKISAFPLFLSTVFRYPVVLTELT